MDTRFPAALAGLQTCLSRLCEQLQRAATESGYNALSYFGSLNRGRNDVTPKSRVLVQSLLFSMLQRFPAVTSHGDPELFNAEIFVAAKTDLDLSWRIFVECLRVLPSPMVYIVIEGVDHVDVTKDQIADFESFLSRLGSISADLLDEKVIKVALTSVRPNAGFQHLFPSRDRLEVVHEHKLLIRVPAAAARRRKPRSKMQKKNSLNLFSPGLTVEPGPRDTGSDFAPSDSGGESDGDASDSSFDFDIYGKGKEKIDHARYPWSNLTPENSRASPVQLGSGERLETTKGQDAENSDSSFDIYEKTTTELPQEKPVSEEDLSDFAP
ncbi:hypothetical protein CTAM01_10500 [Colletotrichum tamarilloi]|uniref:Uncharacterized protein n=1 Tax=Colletotrichum tamarilloi TaxID=1209934 RepID=A0ABQ9R028_9PEZI|nr:uncharacterized protein CTAM01_10500 [Colletotrichum tamarilloi]KAK1490790.1 hypothetical protein CTAM01_10500 [Colletotrichum tamarilloi]